MIYKGPVVLSDGHGHEVKIGYVQLWVEQEPVDVGTGGVHDLVSGLASWHGQGRVPGLVYRLVDILGGEVEVILPDGRRGKAFATGYSQDSAWVIELAGIGRPPE